MHVNKETESWYLEQILLGNIVLENNNLYYLSKLFNSCNTGGYERFSIYPDGWKGKRRDIQKHRLLWMFMHRQLIPDDLQINHEDGCKINNTISNFKLMTNQENVQHAFDTGLAKRTYEANVKAVENNPKAVFSNSDVVKYRQLYDEGKVSIQDISKMFSCSDRTASDMLNRKRYNHI